MKTGFGRTLRLTAGVILLILGVIGSVLPVLQGWLFFLLAALMFFPNHPRTEKGLKKLEGRFPRFAGWLRRRGCGVAEDSLANVDVGQWMHEHHLSLNLHHREHAPEKVEGTEDQTQNAERRT